MYILLSLFIKNKLKTLILLVVFFGSLVSLKESVGHNKLEQKFYKNKLVIPENDETKHENLIII